MDLNKKIEKYIEVLIIKGLNVKKGDYVTIFSDVKNSGFAQKLVKTAYTYGAKYASVKYSDEKITKYKCHYASDEIIDIFPKSEELFYQEQLNNNSKRLTVISPNIDIFEDIDPNKLMRLEKASREALKDYKEATMSDVINWTLAAVPNYEWAKKVFPNKNKEESFNSLWEEIFKSAHLYDGDNPVNNWTNHMNKLNKRAQVLNDMNIKSLHYSNFLGTDLHVGLPKGHRWLGGGSINVNTKEFFSPNIPTEEVYTLADCNHINGIVYSSKPLVFGGKTIDNFYLVFKDGKVIDYKAQKGHEMLKEILNTDEGSRSFGEVALVPYKSPISLSGLLFYNTLFDENASCHFALGQAYPTSLSDYDSISAEEKKARGYNESINHVDFMIGTEDLNIEAIDENNNKIVIFKDGNFIDEKF